MLKNIENRYYDSFSKNERKIFIYLKSNDIKSKSIKQIAFENNVSISAIVRFTKKIGYNGFKEFKSHYIYSNNAYQNENIDEESAIINDINLSLIMTNRKIDHNKYRFVAKKIVKKKNVLFYGSSFNYLICQYYSRLLNKINIRSSFFNTDSDKSIIMPNEDVVHIFLSASGTDINFIKIIDKIKTDKTFIVSITSNSYSNINNLVNETISGTFFTKNNFNPYELPIISKYVLQFIIDNIFNLIIESFKSLFSLYIKLNLLKKLENTIR